jgi:hypothetical protein
MHLLVRSVPRSSTAKFERRVSSKQNWKIRLADISGCGKIPNQM